MVFGHIEVFALKKTLFHPPELFQFPIPRGCVVFNQKKCKKT